MIEGIDVAGRPSKSSAIQGKKGRIRHYRGLDVS